MSTSVIDSLCCNYCFLKPLGGGARLPRPVDSFLAMSSQESPLDALSSGPDDRKVTEVRPSMSRRKVVGKRSLSRHGSNVSSEPPRKKNKSSGESFGRSSGARSSGGGSGQRPSSVGPCIQRRSPVRQRRSSPSPPRRSQSSPKRVRRSRSRSPRREASRPSTKKILRPAAELRTRSAPVDRATKTCSYCRKPVAFEERARGFLLMHDECAKARRAENDKFRHEEILLNNL